MFTELGNHEPSLREIKDFDLQWKDYKAKEALMKTKAARFNTTHLDVLTGLADSD